ncbi:MAG: Rrf2 family transcriptional regulator [Candidatus Tectimicrobiota bacterium]|nr:MAG: Rrf2 family transcriptional regulator [Candidatus Tectomicrobia bacterium]
MPGLRFSQSTDMAIHGLWALAQLEGRRFVLLGDIARSQNVSESYLSKVFQKLTRAGLVHAVRGKNGGYALARAPESITLGDVVRAMEADQPMYQCLAQERCCEALQDCLLLQTFGEAERQMYAVLDRVTLADLRHDFLRNAQRMTWLHAQAPPAPEPETVPAASA